jgi:uncharacterized protein YcbX
MATVSALTYYPVKGCAGVSVSAARFESTGIVHDRSFMLVDEEGAFLSQRNLPGLAVLRPAVAEDGTRMVVGADDIELDVVVDGPRRPVSLFEKWFGDGVDQGDTAAKWFSAVLDRPARLVRVPPEHDRDGWGLHRGKVGFADAHAVLLIAESSLEHLNQRIEKHGAAPVPMDRFRANIVVSGWPLPHTEDRARLLSVGTVELGYSVRAVRCAVPMVAQDTGLRTGPEPIRSLAGYRREPEFGNGVSFGMRAAVLAGGRIAVGDDVVVRQWQEDD